MSEEPESLSVFASSSPAPVHISSASVQPFLDTSPDALVIVNKAGAIVMVNGQTEGAFGYTRSELSGGHSNCSSPRAFTRAKSPTGSAISPHHELAPWRLDCTSSHGQSPEDGSGRPSRPWRLGLSPASPEDSRRRGLYTGEGRPIGGLTVETTSQNSLAPARCWRRSRR